jgi:PEP-CTERM motif
MIRLLLIGSTIGMAAASSVWGALYVDINDVSATGPAFTQTGFVEVTRTGTSGLLTDIGTLDIGFSPFVGTTIDDRDRGALNASQPLGQLLRDVMFLNATLPLQGTLDTTISGLNAGTYLFTGYYHDSNVNHASGDIQISVDSGSTFPIEQQDALFSTTTNPTEIGRSSLAFTVSGGNSVVYRIIGTGGTPGTTFTSETALLNGFVIEPFTTLGDFDRMNGVDVNDYFILSNNLGTHLDGNFVGHAGGDINLDGRVDLDDFGQFKALFPAVAAAAAASVPEPSIISLALLASGGAFVLRRKRLA